MTENMQEHDRVWHPLTDQTLDLLLERSRLQFSLPYLLPSQQNDVLELVYQILRERNRHLAPMDQHPFLPRYNQLNLWSHVISFYAARENLRFWREQKDLGALVALETSTQQLEVCLQEESSETQIHKVKYLDFLQDCLPLKDVGLTHTRNTHQEVLHFKDKSHQDEKEIRVFLLPKEARAIAHHRLLPVDLNALISRMVVSPFASVDFWINLSHRVQSRGLQCTVEWSSYVAGLHQQPLPPNMIKDGWLGFIGLPLGDEKYPVPEKPKHPSRPSREIQDLLETHFMVENPEDTSDPQDNPGSKHK